MCRNFRGGTKADKLPTNQWKAFFCLLSHKIHFLGSHFNFSDENSERVCQNIMHIERFAKKIGWEQLKNTTK